MMVNENTRNVLIGLVLVGALIFLGNQGGLFSVTGDQFTQAQKDAEPNEIVTVEKDLNIYESIHWAQTYDEEETATISITVPEMSEIQEVSYTGSTTAFGSTNRAEAEVSGGEMYARSLSQDVGNDGDVSSDSDVGVDYSTYFTENRKEFTMDGYVFVSYRNSNNYAQSKGTLSVTYKHIENITVWKFQEGSWFETGECVPEEYRSDKAPDISKEGIYETQDECLNSSDISVTVYHIENGECVEEEFTDNVPEDSYKTLDECQENLTSNGDGTQPPSDDGFLQTLRDFFNAFLESLRVI